MLGVPVKTPVKPSNFLWEGANGLDKMGGVADSSRLKIVICLMDTFQFIQGYVE
jgi:hypothetical protein